MLLIANFILLLLLT